MNKAKLKDLHERTIALGKKTNMVAKTTPIAFILVIAGFTLILLNIRNIGLAIDISGLMLSLFNVINSGKNLMENSKLKKELLELTEK